MDDIVIYPRGGKLLAIAAGALLFVLAGVWLVIDREAMEVPSWAVIVVLCIGVPFFGFAFIYAIYRLFIRKPSVVVNREGIFDNASPLGAGMLRWEEIEDIYALNLMGQRFLAIVAVDIQAVMARQFLLKRAIITINMWTMGVPFVIAPTTLSVSVDTLLRRIRRYRDHMRYAS